MYVTNFGYYLEAEEGMAFLCNKNRPGACGRHRWPFMLQWLAYGAIQGDDVLRDTIKGLEDLMSEAEKLPLRLCSGYL